MVCKWYRDYELEHQVGLGFAATQEDGIAYVEPWIKTEDGHFVTCWAMDRGVSGSRSLETDPHYQK